MKKEADVKEYVKSVLRSYTPCWWFMPPANGYGKSGVPDFVGCINGKFFAIETKFGSNKPTAMQWREIMNIDKASGRTWIINDKNYTEWASDFAGWVASCS